MTSPDSAVLLLIQTALASSSDPAAKMMSNFPVYKGNWSVPTLGGKYGAVLAADVKLSDGRRARLFGNYDPTPARSAMAPYRADFDPKEGIAMCVPGCCPIAALSYASMVGALAPLSGPPPGALLAPNTPSPPPVTRTTRVPLGPISPFVPNGRRGCMVRNGRYRRNPGAVVQSLMSGSKRPETLSDREVVEALRDPECPSKMFAKLVRSGGEALGTDGYKAVAKRGIVGVPERVEAAITNPNIPPRVWMSFASFDWVLALRNPALAWWGVDDPSLMKDVAESNTMADLFGHAAGIRKRLDGRELLPSDRYNLKIISDEIKDGLRRLDRADPFILDDSLHCLALAAEAREHGYFVGIPWVPPVFDYILENAPDSREPWVRRVRAFLTDLSMDVGR